ncbi:hatching enzyme 1.2-like [Anopheles ziemanni]|uniref:hatching enzyme 1.2-like n=1 Tax=Anopheles coustani TaxID=139045 RepID=UPI00265A8BD7|nr:hatching enzyme 1.2-like [Anopheles coustani]XP_058177666.1 hatching enzyme 1.2-like [Anopheles ziemanni]
MRQCASIGTLQLVAIVGLVLIVGEKRCLGQLYHTDSYELGKIVQHYDSNATDQPPAHELGYGHYYEGDIMLPAPSGEDRLSLAEYQTYSLWPNAVVPYGFVRGNFTPSEMLTIERAMQVFHVNTCVRFVPNPRAEYFVTIINRPSGCHSSLGRQLDNSKNRMNLQAPACLTRGTPIHELMHILGFLHEMSRPDRDDYIRINRDAFKPEFQTDTFFNVNFGKRETNVETYNISYDYGSIMHYSRYAGAQNRKYPVMENLQPYDKDDFGNTTLSPSDIAAINYRYCRNKNSLDTVKYIFNPYQIPMIRPKE